MKNLLLASTALVALAGAASAEIALTGTGRMGLVYDQSNDVVAYDDQGVQVPSSEMRFSSRMRLVINMTFESDLGLTFGGSFRADQAQAANDGLAGVVYASGDFGKLEMGDVSSAAEMAVGNISGVGYTGLGDPNETFYLITGGGDELGNDDSFQGLALPGVLYTYTTGAVNLYLGLGNPMGISSGEAAADGSFFGLIAYKAGDFLSSSNQVSLGASYTVDNYSFGIGYENATIQVDDITNQVVRKDTLDAYYLGGSATFGGAVIKAMWGQVDQLDYQQYGLSLDYTFDAFTATAFVRQGDLDEQTDATGAVTRQSVTRTVWGLGGSYDLGGGLAVAGGVVDPDLDVEDYRADFGVTFKF